MATDFDFDGTFNEDADDENGLKEEFEELDRDEAADEEVNGHEPPRRSPLRFIILILFILVLLCIGCLAIIRWGLLPFDIPGLDQALSFVSAPGQATPPPQPTEAEVLPPPATEEPAPAPATEEPVEEETQAPTTETGDELPAATETPEPTIEAEEEPPATVEPTLEPTEEPTEAPTLVAEATEEVVSEHDEEVMAATATTVPVPGPTATQVPTVAAVSACDNNDPPTADAGGPYMAMRGKGQAIINFDGSNSTDADGTITSYEWDFGDDSPSESGETVTHGYSDPGTYELSLIVKDNCGATALDITSVTVTGPTPPANNDDDTPSTAPPTSTPSSETSTPPASGTLGFCYRVQHGDTLSGLAWRFGVSWPNLAIVNRVKMSYYVIAGQGLFIPTGEITQGPNVYEVQPDDTLNSIAFHCGLTTTALAQANGLTPEASLSPGQQLTIPLWRY